MLRFLSRAAVIIIGAVLGGLLFVLDFGIRLETEPVLSDAELGRTAVIYVLCGVAAIILAIGALHRGWVALVCGAGVIVLGGFSPLGAPLALWVLFSMCARSPWRWPATAAASMAAAAVITLLFMPAGSDTAERVVAVAGFVVITVTAVFTGVVRRLKRESRAREVEEARSRARSAERLRIARDVHDTLSHRLSIIAMHAGALECQAAKDPAAAAAVAGTVREAAREAGADLRAVLTTLREEPAGTEPQLDFDRLGPIDWRTPLTADQVQAGPALAAHTVYRVLQEGLTNARKHAPGHVATATVRQAGDRLLVQVENRLGPGAQPADPGYGIIGLEERLRLIGGTLEAGRAADSFILRAEVPWT